MIKEKYIEGIPGYLIFLDNVRIDQFVKSFDTQLSPDGSIGSASIDMIYIPDFYKIYDRDKSSGESTSVQHGIENMTNLKIFIKNMVNQKYIMVFDGNIKGKSLSKSGGSYSLMFTASDYMTWLNRTIVPIAVPIEKSITSGDRLKWKAQGIDINNVPNVTSASDSLFRGKTLKTFIDTMVNATLKLNKTYVDSDSVAVWDDIISRIKIMGDISDNLIQNKVIDFVVTSSATFINSMYIGINDVAKNLMFEFYQDRDGVVRIKPPYWNEKILKDHIIEPSFIISFSENTNWNNYFTRVVVTGGVEEQEEQLDELDQSMITPSGAYVGSENVKNEIWSDYTSGDIGTFGILGSETAYGGKYNKYNKVLNSSAEVDSIINQESAYVGLSLNVATALIATESGGEIDSINHNKGGSTDYGLAQINDRGAVLGAYNGKTFTLSTGEIIKVDSENYKTNARLNVHMGFKAMSSYLAATGSNPYMSYAMYNVGPGSLSWVKNYLKRQGVSDSEMINMLSDISKEQIAKVITQHTGKSDGANNLLKNFAPKYEKCTIAVIPSNIPVTVTTTENKNSSLGKTGTWLDKFKIVSLYKEQRSKPKPHLHGGIDYNLPINTPINHIGGTGIANKMDEGEGKGFGTYVRVDIIKGPYKGYKIYYGHMSSISIQNGEEVSAGKLIGYSGNSGYSTGPHLHFEVRKSDGQTTINPEVYASDSEGAAISSITNVTSVGSDQLLYPSPEERKYGISVYDVSQPLIKFSNSVDIDRENNGRDALQKYAKFMYNLLNSGTEAANIQTIAMPWIRPGFNVWVDPVAIDKVYYVNSVSHHGSAEGGVYTTLGLSMGRERVNFSNQKGIGSMKSSGSDNLFINTLYQKSEDFGKVVDGNDFEKIRKTCISFYQKEFDQIIKASNSSYLNNFYQNINYDKKVENSSNGRLTSHIFNRDYTAEEIQSKLNTIYASAPSVIKNRVSKLKRIMTNAKTYIKLHYVSEYK